MSEHKEKTPGELRRELLCYQPKNGYDRMAAEEQGVMDAYCQGYQEFLDQGKTERECVSHAVKLAEARGFRPLVRGMALKAGDKVKFEKVSIQAAQEALLNQRAALRTLRRSLDM